MISPVKIWRNQKYVREYLGQTGKLVSWTVIRVPPAGFASLAPYAVGLIRLKSGKNVVCQMVETDFSGLSRGTQVKLVVRRVREPDDGSVIAYGIKAEVL